MLTKQDILLVKGTQMESRRVREPRRTTLPRGLQSQFYGDGISFQGVLSQSFSESFLVVHALTLFSQDQREKDSGRWSDRWCHLLTFPELFWLVETY